MKNTDIWFVIVTYKPDKVALGRLRKTLEGWPVEVVDNTDKNLGFGGGANVGMKKAFDAGAAWAIVCNQDVTLTKQGVAKFVKALEHCATGIAGPEAGSLDPKRWTTVLASRPGLEARSVHYISGSFMAIHRDVWEATGGFYESYFMYYEDVDLCIRAKKANFALEQVKIVGFQHESHGSDASKEYYLARNHLLFVWRLAPLTVKLYEFFRLPKTLFELWS